jgi:hypothetical protein
MREFNLLPNSTNDEDPTAPSYFVGNKSKGIILGFSRMTALMKKNYWMTRSSKWILIFQIVIPILLILCGITGANRGLRNRDREMFSQITINIKNFEDPFALYSIRDAVSLNQKHHNYK